MKDYKITKIWADEIASQSERIDNLISDYKTSAEEYQNDENEYRKIWSEEYQERINCLEWILTQINMPLKIKK